MKKLPLILIGGGGHCRSCIDVIEWEDKYTIQGIVDANEKPGIMISGYPVLGDDTLLPKLIAEGNFFLITIGQIKSAATRVKLFEQLKSAGAKLATIISPRAHISSRAKLEEGTIVLHRAVVNADATIGRNTIINSLSLIEHDAIIGDHVHISTGALINGGCSVGNETFIGSGTVIANNIAVGNNVIIGAGSVVVNDIEMAGTYIGSPVKRI